MILKNEPHNTFKVEMNWKNAMVWPNDKQSSAHHKLTSDCQQMAAELSHYWQRSPQKLNSNKMNVQILQSLYPQLQSIESIQMLEVIITVHELGLKYPAANIFNRKATHSVEIHEGTAPYYT